MKIEIENIKEGFSIYEAECKPEEIDFEIENVDFTDLISVKLDLFKQNDKIYVKANLAVTIQTECAKCLKPSTMILEGTSENQYRPMPNTVYDPPEGIGIRYYLDDVIDFTEDFRECLFLEIPPRILCSETCKGLCPKCGKDLNTGDCDCNTEIEEIKNKKFGDLIKELDLKKKLEV
ncbi:hypothetical protein GF312_13255 [Candidatus Poribacteria bacterium]|nr:hypothetical protein [Candidatus Poribacteria bacterium]